MKTFFKCFGFDDDDLNTNRLEVNLQKEGTRIKTKKQKTQQNIGKLQASGRHSEVKLEIIKLNSLTEQEKANEQQRQIITLLSSKIQEATRYKKFESEYQQFLKYTKQNFDFTNRKYEECLNNTKIIVEGLKKADEFCDQLEKTLRTDESRSLLQACKQQNEQKSEEENFITYFQQVVSNFREQIQNLANKQENSKQTNESLHRLIEEQRKENEKLLNQNIQHIDKFYQTFLQKIDSCSNKSNFVEELKVTKQIMETQNQQQQQVHEKQHQQFSNEMAKLQESLRNSQTEAESFKLKYEQEKQAHDILQSKFGKKKQKNLQLKSDIDQQAKNIDLQAKKLEDLNVEIKDLNVEIKDLLLKLQESREIYTKQIKQLEGNQNQCLFQKLDQENKLNMKIERQIEQNISLTREVESLKTQNERLDKQLQEMNQEKENLNKQLSSVQSELNYLNSKLKEKNKENEKLTENIRCLDLLMIAEVEKLNQNIKEQESLRYKWTKKCLSNENELKKANDRIIRINQDRMEDIQNSKQIWKLYRSQEQQNSQFIEKMEKHQIVLNERIREIDILNKQIIEKDSIISNMESRIIDLP